MTTSRPIAEVLAGNAGPPCGSASIASSNAAPALPPLTGCSPACTPDGAAASPQSRPLPEDRDSVVGRELACSLGALGIALGLVKIQKREAFRGRTAFFWSSFRRNTAISIRDSGSPAWHRARHAVADHRHDEFERAQHRRFARGVRAIEG